MMQFSFADLWDSFRASFSVFNSETDAIPFADDQSRGLAESIAVEQTTTQPDFTAPPGSDFF